MFTWIRNRFKTSTSTKDSGDYGVIREPIYIGRCCNEEYSICRHYHRQQQQEQQHLRHQFNHQNKLYLIPKNK